MPTSTCHIYISNDSSLSTGHYRSSCEIIIATDDDDDHYHICSIFVATTALATTTTTTGSHTTFQITIILFEYTIPYESSIYRTSIFITNTFTTDIITIVNVKFVRYTIIFEQQRFVQYGSVPQNTNDQNPGTHSEYQRTAIGPFGSWLETPIIQTHNYKDSYTLYCSGSWLDGKFQRIILLTIPIDPAR